MCLIAVLGILALAALPLGCGDDEEVVTGPSGTPSSQSVPEAPAPRSISNCQIGEKPTYFVPHSPGTNVLIVGCAELGVSGRPVELSVNPGRFRGEPDLCLNPAFASRKNPGSFIPTVCGPGFGNRLEILDAAVPKQGVEGYQLVLWGATPGSETVTARYGSSETEAAVFRVPREGRIADDALSLFVVELPLAAACEDIAVVDDAGREDRVPAKTRICNAGG